MKICVIGAGSSGLTAIKACKEEHLDVDCFETSDGIGGLWKYHDDTHEGTPSVMKSTIINTSKEMSAFSDFPPPKEFPNFMHNTLMLEYFKRYAKNFDLLRHVRFRCKVVKVEMDDDYEDTGRWRVTIQDLQSGETFTRTYDGVMVCSGHHTFPNRPHFEGLDDFQGRVIHTHSLKSDKGYEGKSVLVVGIGNSAVDAAVELGRVSKKLYLSTRKGSWIYPRLFLKGTPTDLYLQRRIFNCLIPLSACIANSLLETALNYFFDHEVYGLKPAHRVLNAHPTINDTIPQFISSGKIILKQNIERFTKEGVIFEGEDTTTKIDDVVLATGYKIKYDFFEEDIIKVKENKVDFYKLAFPAHLPHPSLVFIGLIQPTGSIFPIAEVQSRWYVQLMIGKHKLPSTDQMKKDVNDRHEYLSKRYAHSPRHTIQVEYLSYMDEIAGQFGAKPNLWKLAVTDPVLYQACVFGPCTPYQYRLQGPHMWDGARDAILSMQERVEAPMQTRKML